MVTYEITRNGNYGVIRPIPEGRLSAGFLRYMSYKKQGAEFMPRPEWAIVKLYSVKKGMFPWGLRYLAHDIMSKWCEIVPDEHFNSNFLYRKELKENMKIGFELFDPMFESDLRPYQIDAVSKMTLEEGGVLCMPTGAGKTRTIIAYLKLMRLPSVVIVTTLDIKRQWERQVEKWSFIRVINYQSKLCMDFVKASNIVVFDECHHVSAKTIYKLAMKSLTDTILIGCSATPKREDGEDMRITAALGKIIYNISKRELINSGFLSDARVRYYPTRFDDSEQDFQTYAEIYKTNIVENRTRNDQIIAVTDKIVKDGYKILILVSQIAHGQLIFDELAHHNKIYVHGNSKNRDQDMSKYDIIVASNIFNEGVDLPSLDVLIIAAGGKSSIQLTQKVGRVLRPSVGKKYALIIDFIDTPKFLCDHYAKRRAILEEDFEVTTVDNE